MQMDYHNDVMIKRAEELIKDGRCRVKVMLIDDRMEDVNCSREYGYEFYNVDILKQILEVIR
jgi:hypothetical protein